MYQPKHFQMTDLAAMHEVMRRNDFATLVSAADGEIVATHLPFMLSEGGEAGLGRLRAHMARANDHWRQFDGATEALVIFQGVHGYISPAWYDSPRSVPTWDYVAVHAYGTPRVIDEPAAVLAMLHDLVHVHEDRRATPWRSENLEPGYLEGMAKAVVAFEIPISRLEGKEKLGQNRPAEQANVAAMLEATQPELASRIRQANGVE